MEPILHGFSFSFSFGLQGRHTNNGTGWMYSSLVPNAGRPSTRCSCTLSLGRLRRCICNTEILSRGSSTLMKWNLSLGSMASIGKSRASAIVSQIATPPLFLRPTFVHIAPLLPHSGTHGPMQFLGPLSPGLAEGRSRPSQWSSAEGEEYPGRDGSLSSDDKDKQLSTLSLTPTANLGSPVGLKCWNVRMEAREPGKNLFHTPNSTHDHPRRRDLTRNLSLLRGNTVSPSCNISFHNKSTNTCNSEEAQSGKVSVCAKWTLLIEHKLPARGRRSFKKTAESCGRQAVSQWGQRQVRGLVDIYGEQGAGSQ